MRFYWLAALPSNFSLVVIFRYRCSFAYLELFKPLIVFEIFELCTAFKL